MKLEEQVTSLELSKQLKELGVKQESYFKWVNSVISKKWVIQSVIFEEEETISAFTVSEILEIYPRQALIDGEIHFTNLGKIIEYKNKGTNYANVIAESLIKGLEEKIINLKS